MADNSAKDSAQQNDSPAKPSSDIPADVGSSADAAKVSGDGGASSTEPTSGFSLQACLNARLTAMREGRDRVQKEWKATPWQEKIRQKDPNFQFPEHKVLTADPSFAFPEFSASRVRDDTDNDLLDGEATKEELAQSDDKHYELRMAGEDLDLKDEKEKTLHEEIMQLAEAAEKDFEVREWEEFGIHEALAKALRKHGYTHPWPEQKFVCTITNKYKRNSVVCTGPDGSGKSVSTIVKAIDIALKENIKQRNLERDKKRGNLRKNGNHEAAKALQTAETRETNMTIMPLVLIVAPTRIGADQIARFCRKLIDTGELGLQLAVCFGGEVWPSKISHPLPKGYTTHDLDMYAPIDILVGCPGRLMHMIEKGTMISLGWVKVTVWDDANVLFIPRLLEARNKHVARVVEEVRGMSAHGMSLINSTMMSKELAADLCENLIDHQGTGEATEVKYSGGDDVATNAELIFINVKDPEVARWFEHLPDWLSHNHRMAGLLQAIEEVLQRFVRHEIGLSTLIAAHNARTCDDIELALIGTQQDGEQDLSDSIRTIHGEYSAEQNDYHFEDFNDVKGSCFWLISTSIYAATGINWACKPTVVCYDVSHEIDTASGISMWQALKRRTGGVGISGLCITLLDPEQGSDHDFIRKLVPYLEQRDLPVPDFMKEISDAQVKADEEKENND